VNVEAKQGEKNMIRTLSLALALSACAAFRRGAQSLKNRDRNNPDCVAQLRDRVRRAGPMKILAIVATLLIWCTSLGAHQPGDEFAEWYRSLKVPGVDQNIINAQERSCCSPDRDCKTVDYQTDAAGSYWIVADGEPVQIPPDKILQRTDNPTGRAVACWNYYNGHPQVRCFVRPPES
jgi:hypothetical protein